MMLHKYGNKIIGLILLYTITLHSSNFKTFVRNLAEQAEQEEQFPYIRGLYYSLAPTHKRIIDQSIKTKTSYKWVYLYLKGMELYVPFDQSLMPAPDFDTLSPEEHAWWDRMKNWYERHSLRVIRPAKEAKIPKIIHQIWLGPHPFPAQFEAARQSVIQYHPDWEYRLWTDEDVESFGLVNRNLFDMARNYGEKSDIFRYEILERYGGVYLDVDVACIQSLDILHHCYQFYTGISFRSLPGIANGIIGCAAHHPIIALCITSMIDEGSKIDPNDIIRRSGPVHFMNCFMQLFERCDDCIALPPSYFYCIPNTERGASQEENAQWARAESFTLHYWGCTWQNHGE